MIKIFFNLLTLQRKCVSHLSHKVAVYVNISLTFYPILVEIESEWYILIVRFDFPSPLPELLSDRLHFPGGHTAGALGRHRDNYPCYINTIVQIASPKNVSF